MYFQIQEWTKVCSRHFREYEFIKALSGRRDLRSNAVPSLFPWTRTGPQQSMKLIIDGNRSQKFLWLSIIIDYQHQLIINGNRWQSISINRLILIIDGQSMTEIFVIIHYHRLSISIDGNRSMNIIDYYQICNISRLPIQSNISIVSFIEY